MGPPSPRSPPAPLWQRLGFHVENSPLAVVEFDEKSRIAFWSQAAERLFGWTAGEVFGKTIGELRWVHEKDAAEVAALGVEMAAGRLPFNVHTNRNYRKDGSVVICEWHNSAMADAAGRLVSSLSLILDVTERKRAEQKLRESEYFLNKSQKVAKLGSYKMDVADNTWRGSPTLDEIFGIGDRYPRNTNGWLELVVPEQRQEMAQFLKQVLEERSRFEKEYRIVRPNDRQERWVFWTGEPEYDERGRLLLMIGTIQDITDHKSATIELQKANEFAVNLIQTANSIIVGLDVDGRITLFNKAAGEITGYTHAELAGRNWFEVLVPRKRYPHVWTEFARLLNEGPPVRFENPILTKSGEERFIAWQNSVVREQGRIVGTISVGMDITERRRTEEELRTHREHLEELVAERTRELRDSEEMFRRMTASARSAIIMMDGAGRITFWNEAAERTFGWPAAEAMGQDVHALIAPARYHADFHKGMAGFQRTGQGPVIGKHLELVAVRRTGEEFPVELALSAIQLHGVWHALGIINDVTQRKQAEEAIQRNTAQLETFNQAMIGREKRMIELKEEVNRLCALLNQPPPYPPIWRQTNPPVGGPEKA
jgi:PAS domain S-box-containing protein